MDEPAVSERRPEPGIKGRNPSRSDPKGTLEAPYYTTPMGGGFPAADRIGGALAARGESPASTETVPAPAGQGAIGAHTGSMCPNRNAVRRDAAGTVECRDDFCHGLLAPATPGWRGGTARGDAQRTALEHGCEGAFTRQAGNAPRSGTGWSLAAGRRRRL